MRLLTLVVLLALVAHAAPARAQSQVCPPDCRFNADQVVTLSWQHDPAASADGQVGAALGYRIYLDKATKIGEDISIDKLVAGTVTLPDVKLSFSNGTHTLEVAAFNDQGERRGKPVTITIGPPLPRAPTNLKITGSLTVALGADGVWRFTLALSGEPQ